MAKKKWIAKRFVVVTSRRGTAVSVHAWDGAQAGAAKQAWSSPDTPDSVVRYDSIGAARIYQEVTPASVRRLRRLRHGSADVPEEPEGKVQTPAKDGRWGVIWQIWNDPWKLQINRYLEKPGDSCLCCGSSDVETLDTPSAGFDRTKLKVFSCNRCGAHWSTTTTVRLGRGPTKAAYLGRNPAHG